MAANWAFQGATNKQFGLLRPRLSAAGASSTWSAALTAMSGPLPGS